MAAQTGSRIGTLRSIVLIRKGKDGKRLSVNLADFLE